MFTPAEVEQLRSFCKLCDQIAKCRFIVDLPKQPHHIFVGKLPDGRVVDEYPRYDDDDFRAFLTHYRKLRAKRDNPTQLFQIMNLLKREDPADRPLLDHFKHEINEEEKGWWGAVRREEGREPILITQSELEDLILNGEVFHLAPDKEKELAQVIGGAQLTKAVAFFNYLRLVRNVIHYAQRTAELIVQRGSDLVCGARARPAAHQDGLRRIPAARGGTITSHECRRE
jgi:hypothetical protein